jgi:hypothetical protein
MVLLEMELDTEEVLPARVPSREGSKLALLSGTQLLQVNQETLLNT